MSTDRNSRSRSRSAEDLSQNPFKFSIPQDQISHFNDHELINKIKTKSGAIKIAINQKLESSNYPDGIISIFGSVPDKLSAFSMVSNMQFLDEISILSPSEKISIDVFVPESKVRIIVGVSGQQISLIQKSSNSQISVQKSLNGIRERPVKVTGKPQEVKEGIVTIYKMIFDKRTSPKRVKPIQPEGPSYRFAAPAEIIKELVSRHTSLNKKLRAEFNVEITVRDSKSPLKESESVVVIYIYRLL